MLYQVIGVGRKEGELCDPSFWYSYKTKGAQHGDVLHAFVRNGKGPLYFYKYATPLFRSCSVMLLLWQTVQKVQGLFGDSCKIVVHHAFLPKIVKPLCRSADDY